MAASTALQLYNSTATGTSTSGPNARSDLPLPRISLETASKIGKKNFSSSSNRTKRRPLQLTIVPPEGLEFLLKKASHSYRRGKGIVEIYQTSLLKRTTSATHTTIKTATACCFSRNATPRSANRPRTPLTPAEYRIVTPIAFRRTPSTPLAPHYIEELGESPTTTFEQSQVVPAPVCDTPVNASHEYSLKLGQLLASLKEIRKPKAALAGVSRPHQPKGSGTFQETKGQTPKTTSTVKRTMLAAILTPVEQVQQVEHLETSCITPARTHFEVKEIDVPEHTSLEPVKENAEPQIIQNTTTTTTTTLFENEREAEYELTSPFHITNKQGVYYPTNTNAAASIELWDVGLEPSLWNEFSSACSSSPSFTLQSCSSDHLIPSSSPLMSTHMNMNLNMNMNMNMNMHMNMNMNMNNSYFKLSSDEGVFHSDDGPFGTRLVDGTQELVYNSMAAAAAQVIPFMEMAAPMYQQYRHPIGDMVASEQGQQLQLQQQYSPMQIMQYMEVPLQHMQVLVPISGAKEAVNCDVFMEDIMQAGSQGLQVDMVEEVQSSPLADNESDEDYAEDLEENGMFVPTYDCSGSSQGSSNLSSSPNLPMHIDRGMMRISRKNGKGSKAWTNHAVVAGQHVALMSENAARFAKALPGKKGKYFCSHCPSPYRTILELCEHMDRVGVTRPFHCPEIDCPWHVCGFPTASEWTRHTRSQHGKGDKMYCGDCNKAFTRKDSLKRHAMLVHDNEDSRYNRKMRKMAAKKRC